MDVFLSKGKSMRQPVRRLHNIIGLVVGFQLLLWAISGLFFTVYPIDKVRGTTLRTPINHGALALGQVAVSASEAADILDSHTPVKTVELDMFFGEPVWRIEAGDQFHLVSARTGELRSPIMAETAARIANEGMADRVGAAGAPWLMEADAPREYSGPLPAYVVDFEHGGTRAYIDASTGQLVTVRTRVWRIFDMMWRVHIMDVTGDDRIDSWWMKMFSFFGLTMAITGAILLIRRIRQGKLFS